MSRYLRPEDVLPHRDSLLLLRRILHQAEEDLEAIAMVRSDSAIGNEGAFPMTLLVEMAAQAAAYHAGSGFVRDGKQPAEKGYLVRLRGVKFEAATVRANQEVLVRVHRVGAMGGLAMYEFTALRNELAVASGSLSIMST